MSEHAPLSALPLFAPRAEEPVPTIHEHGEERHAAWFARARRLVHGVWKGQQVTTDEVWWTLERYGVALPEGASPKLLGSFFSGWSLARPAVNADGSQKWTRSKRPEAHGNLLKVWTLEH